MTKQPPATHQALRFCAQESLGRQESFLGTTTSAKCYLLIEYASRWSSNTNRLLEESVIPSDAVAHLRAFQKWCPDGVKLLFIKNRGRHTGKLKIYLIRCGDETGGVSEFDLDSYDAISGIDLQQAYQNIGPHLDLLVVCTHGKRDKCCAKFGYPIYKELRHGLAALGREFNIWECSHVGGDRFAANAIWLPYGIGFSHMQRGTGGLIAKLVAKKISLLHFRGSSPLPSAAQYLEGLVRRKYSLEQPGGVTLMQYHEEKSSTGRVVADVKLSFSELAHRAIVGRVSVQHDSSDGKVLVSCNTGGRAFPRVFELLHNEKLEIS